MRTVSFRSVLDGAATRLGLRPSENLLTTQAEALVEYINDRLEEAWNCVPWPEWTLCEQRQYRADYDNATAYAAGDEVYYEAQNAYYRALAPTTGNLPTDPNFWAAASDLNMYIARAQSWEDNELGQVWGVYRDDPRTRNRPRRLGWWESPQGIQVDSGATTVWLEFSLVAPHFTTELWDAALTYAEGDLVYLAASGECYRALQSGSNQDPAAASSAYWRQVEFPFLLAKYCKLMAHSDALREDEEMDKAIAIEAQAVDALNDALESVQASMRHPGGFAVQTS